MKKTLTIILVAVMLLSTLVALVVPAAAEGEGNWDVLLTAKSVTEDPAKNPPLPGYYYDETGFHTISPDYTNYNPKFTVISKEMYNIKDFSMTIRVHDYYALNDNWLSISLWDTFNGIDQGGTSGKYGGGWTSLIRGSLGDNSLHLTQSWNQTIGGRANTQKFIALDGTDAAPLYFEENVDPETGDYIITFSIENGVVKINGMPIGAATDACIADYFTSGLAYVAVTLHNTDNSGEHSPTISILDVNGITPEGSDSREAENKNRVIADIIPSDTVPANTPAIWFDGTLSATNSKLPSGTNCQFSFADDNESMLVTVSDALFYSQFDVPDNISYEAADFTYIVYVFKNFCTCSVGEDEKLYDACMGAEVCNVWYCSGSLTTAGGTCVGPFTSMFNVTPMDEDYEYVGEDLYTVGVLQVAHEEWAGRINAIRLDVSGYSQYGNPDRNTFEIMGAGVFRSGDDMIGFLSEFRDLGFNTEDLAYVFSSVCDHFDFDDDGLCDMCYEDMSAIEDPEDPEETTEAPEVTTEAPSETEAPTEAPSETEAPTEAPSETEAPTEAPSETEAPTEAPSETEAPTEAPSETEAPTEAPSETEAITEAPTAAESTTEADTAAPEVTTEATVDTEAPADTTAKEETTTKKEETTTAKKEETTTKAPATSDDNKTEDKKGCKSSVAMGALAIVAIVGTGVVLKKKED